MTNIEQAYIQLGHELPHTPVDPFSIDRMAVSAAIWLSTQRTERFVQLLQGLPGQSDNHGLSGETLVAYRRHQEGGLTDEKAYE